MAGAYPVPWRSRVRSLWQTRNRGRLEQASSRRRGGALVRLVRGGIDGTHRAPGPVPVWAPPNFGLPGKLERDANGVLSASFAARLASFPFAISHCDRAAS
jgi:hypothetical protein